MKYYRHALMALAICSQMNIAVAATMQTLNDNELSVATGQALLNETYLAPGAVPVGGTVANPYANIGFYKVGMEAQLDLNANIKKIQLGCGGFKGPGCDIDIDDLSLTGIVAKNADGSYMNGVATDFSMINPNIQVAVKNPTSASTREIVGLRFGADQAWGMLSMGSPGSDPNSLSSNTGANTISGHLPILIENILVPAHGCIRPSSDHTRCISGYLFPLGNATVDSNEPQKGDNLPDVYLNRDSAITLTGLKAVALKFLNVNVDLTDNLRFVHNIQVGKDSNNNGKYDPGEGSNNMALSVQGQDIQWYSGTQWQRADKGWWLESAPVTMGNFTSAPVYAPLLGTLFGIKVPVTNIGLNSVPVQNCWGTLKFC